jgi:hypothetical protein
LLNGINRLAFISRTRDFFLFKLGDVFLSHSRDVCSSFALTAFEIIDGVAIKHTFVQLTDIPIMPKDMCNSVPFAVP